MISAIHILILLNFLYFSELIYKSWLDSIMMCDVAYRRSISILRLSIFVACS